MNGAAKVINTGCCVLMLLFCASTASVAQPRSLTKKQTARYLRRLPAVNKIELVKFKHHVDAQERQVERSIFIEGAVARRIAALWRTQPYGPDMSACHFPAYGVRFYSKTRPIVYATVCWACNNILFFDPDFKGGLHFDGDYKNGQQLLEIFKGAFSEKKRAKSSPVTSSHSGSRKQ
jgi:hypothetical protein